jgi:UDP-3-O-acyl N-acetylglucosamine deacetylase
MDLPRSQHTIARPVRITGFGYWTGRDVTVEFRPARVNSGVVFIRGDLKQTPRIEASVHHRVETPRRTTLMCDGHRVEMVEHVLAALAGLQIDNCEVWLDQPELPGMDGSCLPITDCLVQAGVRTQAAPRAQLVIRRTTRVGNEEAWVEARPSTWPEAWLQYELDYGPGNAIGRQKFTARLNPETFLRELAPARTFVLREEAEWLRQQGIAQRATYQDLLVFGRSGPIDNDLRFPDECVRHKTLDLVGDLALTGCDLRGHIVAHRSGHRLNAELVKALLRQYQINTFGERTSQPRRRCA